MATKFHRRHRLRAIIESKPFSIVLESCFLNKDILSGAADDLQRQCNIHPNDKASHISFEPEICQAASRLVGVRQEGSN